MDTLTRGQFPPHVQSIKAPTVDASSRDQIAVMTDKIIVFSAQAATKATSGDLLVAVASWQSSLPTPVDLLGKIEPMTHRMDSLL